MYVVLINLLRRKSVAFRDLNIETIVCFGCHKNKYAYFIEQVFFCWCGKSRFRVTKDFLSQGFAPTLSFTGAHNGEM